MDNHWCGAEDARSYADQDWQDFRDEIGMHMAAGVKTVRGLMRASGGDAADVQRAAFENGYTPRLEW